MIFLGGGDYLPAAVPRVRSRMRGVKASQLVLSLMLAVQAAPFPVEDASILRLQEAVFLHSFNAVSEVAFHASVMDARAVLVSPVEVIAVVYSKLVVLSIS